MKNPLLILLLVVVCPLCTGAQPMSTLYHPASPFTDSVRIDALHRLSARNWNANPEQALRHGKTMLHLARQAERPNDEVIALGLISKSHHVLGHQDSALMYNQQAMHLAQSKKYVELEAILKADKARIYNEIGEYSQALSLLFQAAEVFRSRDNIVPLAQTYIHIAMAMYEQGELNDALDYLQRTQNLLTDEDHPGIMAHMRNRRGVIYMDIDQLDVAQDNFVAALQLFGKTRDSIGLGQTFLHMGELYGKRNRYDQAFLFVEQALHIQHTLALAGDVAKSYLAKATLFERIGKPDSASTYYLNALQIASQTGDRSTHLHVLQGLSEVYTEQRKPERAVYYGKQALELAEDLEAEAEIMAAHHNLYRAYDLAYQSAQGYRHLKAYTDLRAQYLGFEEIQKLEAQKFQYGLQQKNSELELMALNQALNEEQLKAKDAEVRRQRSTTWLAVFGLLLTMAILLVLYLFYRSKKKSNTILRKLNFEIIKQKLAIEEINESLDQKVKARTLELEQRNQQLIEYGLYNAHQIRGPLANILGLIGLMKKHGVDTETYPILQKNLEESAHKLDQMVREMNDILEGNRKPKEKPQPSESHT